MRRDYYVYEWFFTETFEVFYIGKGKGTRRFLTNSGRNNHFKEIVSAHKGRVAVRLISLSLTEEEAFDIECDKIAELKCINQCICNQTNGGDGSSGFKHSQETREKIRDSLKRPIIGIKKNTKEVMELGYLMEADLIFGKRSFGNISQCCNGRKKSAYGYVWFHKDKYVKMTEEEINQRLKNENFDYSNRRKPVIGVNQNNIEDIKEFHSITEAGNHLEKIFSVRGDIIACLAGDQKSSQGYVWFYKYEYERLLKDEIIKIIHNSKIKNTYIPPSIKIIGTKIDDPNTIIEFKSLREADRYFGVSVRSSISRCLKGKQKQTKGFVWRSNN
ncbi:NUMOD1 domain-containing protein [Priestia megaterium]|nr:NUMOD1 domain-containing protein [Priestia megaterium]